MHTQRAIRRYEPDPVSDEDITKILKATTHAPSGGNRQPWHFMVVRDAELRKRLGELYWDATSYAREHQGLHKETPTYLRSGYDFAQHIGEFPVHIFPFVETAERGFFMGSNILWQSRICFWLPGAWDWAPAIRVTFSHARRRSRSFWAYLTAGPLPH